jgi:hypothetical protein
MFGSSDAHRKEQLAIERRRQAEAERKQRIFNPKVRLFGVDKQALDAQVADKKQLEAMEEEREQFYHEQTIINAKHGHFLETKRDDIRRDMNKAVNDYRVNQQTVESRREFDLNDKNALKKEQPVRVGDRDPRLGISATQIFHGEDLTQNDRTKQQKNQMKNWIEQQVTEKGQAKAMEEYEKLVSEKRMEEVNFLANELDKQKELLRLEKERATKEFNIEQSVDKRNREAERKAKEELDKLEEIQNQLNSDLLNENFDATLNANDPNRFKPYNFKSLRPDQYQNILDTRENQIREKEYIETKEKLESELDHTREKLNNRMAMRLQREQERVRQDRQKQLAEIHRHQQEENKYKKAQIDDLYANKVTDDFFSQFGTSSR